MARDYYETTIALPDAAAGNAMKPLASVKVSVVPRGTLDPDVPTAATGTSIFPADTGLTKGPDPKSGAIPSAGGNPFTTGASGSVRFWADGPAEYDIVFEDTITPARITDKVGWNAIPAKTGSLATSVLAQDGGIRQAHLAADVIMQQVPIGGITDWWRPQQSVPLPAGFEVADGRSVAHEFPGVAGLVTLPNLQNVFILGATATKNDGSGAGADNAPGSGPGIRGTGGSNLPRNLAHGHAVPLPDHYHNFTIPDHYHLANGGLTTGGHGHGIGTGAGDNAVALVSGSPTGSPVSRSNHTHGGNTDTAGNLGVYGNTSNLSAVGALPGSNTTYSSSANAGFPGTAATSVTTWTADPGTDFRPYFIGLLRLIKVRRTA
jgi:hypothetical protein